MKLKYIGESFGVDGLTNGKIYNAAEGIGTEKGMYRVIDDSGEDYLYSKINPAPLDGSSKGGKWEIVSEKTPNECSKKKTQLCAHRIYRDDERFCEYCGAPTTYAIQKQ